MSQPNTDERFKNNLLDLCALLRETIVYINGQGYNLALKPSMIDIGINLLKGQLAENVINGFINRSYKFVNETTSYWDMCLIKDEKFLIDNVSIIFGEFPQDFLKTFTEIISLKDKENNLVVKIETRESIWAFLHAMIRGSIRYIHEKREMKEIDGKKQYTKEFFPQISISKQVQIWKIKKL